MQVCGYTFDGVECAAEGEHFCIPRADKAQCFFEELLFHTKGPWARKRFILADWQRDEIIRPLFGKVVWSEHFDCYRRRYEIAWIEVSRKNGKALDIATPILTGDGWKTMGDIREGDYVHAADGSLARVSFVSERHHRDCYRVTFADGAELVASDHHLWAVNDRLKGERVIDTAEMFRTQTYGARGDRRYSVTVPDALKRDEVDLPLDPYLFGSWLGDGTSSRAEFTSADPELWDHIESFGFDLSYNYESGRARTRGVRGLVSVLRRMGVLDNKHVPATYLTASESQRRALLQGLMDTDGSVIAGPNTPRVEFCNTNRELAESVLFLARSLGYKATIRESRAAISGRDCGPRYRVCWTAYADDAPFRLARKASRLAPRPSRPTRASTNSIVSVDPVPMVESVCIQVDHPSHVFLAGKSLTPTHNTELLAGIMLYLLCADGEESGEIYGVARDINQAKLAFDVAAQMVKFSPILSKRLKISDYKKRIIDHKTNSFYAVIAADAKSALGSNPSGVGADEILAWQSGDMWHSMRTGMGTRVQPLMVASTTAGNDTEGFAGIMHRKMETVLQNPDLEENRHIFVYLKNTPMDADPWDESNWHISNPALGDFLTMEGLRKQAAEAKNNPIEEMAFRQYRLNQWQSSNVRWMNMMLFDQPNNVSTKYPTNKRLFDAFAGYECWFGLDLAARQDLCSVCYMFPAADPTYGVDVIWRHWMPEATVKKLDRLNDGRFTREFARGGWLTVTDGEVLDFEQFYADIEEDSQRFTILGGDVDKWCSEPVIQQLRLRIGLGMNDIFAYDNQFGMMSDGMKRIFELVKSGLFRWHGNPLARFCFDSTEAKYKLDDPDQIKPVKPDRLMAAKRIDAVPAAIMAMNALAARDEATMSVYASEDVLII